MKDFYISTAICFLCIFVNTYCSLTLDLSALQWMWSSTSFSVYWHFINDWQCSGSLHMLHGHICFLKEYLFKCCPHLSEAGLLHCWNAQVVFFCVQDVSSHISIWKAVHCPAYILQTILVLHLPIQLPILMILCLYLLISAY